MSSKDKLSFINSRKIALWNFSHSKLSTVKTTSFNSLNKETS